MRRSSPCARSPAVRHDQDHPYRARVLDNRPLTTRDAVAEVRHLVLGLDPHAISYTPGDSLGVWFRNAPALVDGVLAATGLDQDAPVDIGGDGLALAEALRTRLELTRLHPTVVTAWAKIAGDAGLAALVQDRDALRAFAHQRQVIDLLTEYPGRPEAAELAALLQPLKPRLYSIASAPAEFEDEVHLTVSVLRYQHQGQDRLGGASGFLAERLAEADPLDCYVAENPSFRLPEDGETPIVLVGAGTGIAPFRAFLQQRAVQGDRGRNWLVFGNRHFQRDFLYQADWLRLRKAGLLHRFSPAFSRDTAATGLCAGPAARRGGRVVALAGGGGTALCLRRRRDGDGGAGDPGRDRSRDHGGLGADAALEFVDNLRADARYLRDTY